MEGSNPVKSFGPAKGLNASKFFDRIRFRDVAALVGAIAVLLLAMGISSVSYKLHKESTEALDNHARVEENSELTYYLTVNEDGVDSSGTQSSDTVTANVKGGMTTVTDRIPDGLEFVGFVTTEDGTIGAAARSDSSIACGGHVIDDTKEEKTDAGTWNADNTEYYYHGLHYDVASRTVSFRVENVQAGCGLTVGIITKTPSLGTNKRLDFYNTANLKEGILNKNSNTMHVWMGRNGLTTYDATYAYTGTVPENAPAAPETQSYVDGVTVQVAGSPIVDGYQFSGWTTSDTPVTLGSFTMPANTVAFTGSFTQKPEGQTYSVTYQIDGDVPEGYVAPKTKSYEAGSMVKLDSTQKGHLMDKYIFSGWSTEDVGLDETGFVMPQKNVVLHGSFEERKYTVSYEFEGEVMPPNAKALLPEAQEYVPGTKVTRAPNPTAEGYAFTGWYKNESFIMPEENVVIYGEWSVQNGVFAPEISIKITNPMKKYGLGDTVKFEVEVKNTAAYPIKDVQVLEQLPGAVFTTGNGYEIKSGDYALIPEIPAGGTVKLNAVYEVQTGDETTLTNTVKIAGAIADNNYNLDTTKEYLATVEFDTALTGIPYDDGTDNANTLDKIAHYAVLGLVAIAGTIASFFMIRRILKNGQLQALAPKAKTGLQGLKNIFSPNTATKGRLLSFAVADIALIAIAVGLGVKLLPQKIADISDPSTINLMSSHADYDAREGGAWKITKSAKWTGDGMAQLTIDVDTVAKNANGRYTDVLFVVDVSGSMDGAKIDRVKQDMTELTDNLMSDGQNQVAMVSFESGAKKELDFTTDKTAAQAAIDSLGTSGCTNYYQAFKEAESVLENYQAQNNRDLFLLFLTDGYPNEDTPNERAEYAYLKGAYPTMVINAIQYEMASEILDPIKAISDNQYIANMDTLNNVLFEASRAPYFYESFNVEDVIDTRYFEVDNSTTIASLNPSLGTAELTEENGQQKISWNMDGLLRSGSSAKLTINLKLKDQYKRVAGEYPTNSSISASSTIPEGRSENENSNETPILKNAYNVYYEANAPSDCTVSNMPGSPETHFVYETVEISETIPACAGYNFSGFVFAESGVQRLNEDYFQMPEKDVTLRGTWTKADMRKSVDGVVYVARPAVLDIGENVNIALKKLSGQTNPAKNTANTSIRRIQEADYLRTDVSSKNIATSTSPFPIYAWYDNGVINYYTDAETIALNSDSSSLLMDIHYLEDVSFMANWNASSAINISSMFFGLLKIANIDYLDEWDTSNVENMGSLFAYTHSLENINGAMSWDTSKVVDMHSLLSGAKKLNDTSGLRNWNTANVKTMANMFFGTESLTNVAGVADWDVSNVETLNSLFGSGVLSSGGGGSSTLILGTYRSTISDISALSDWDTSSVSSMSGMFSGATNLTNIDALANWDTSNVTTLSSALAGTSITNVDALANWDTSNVVNLSSTFRSKTLQNVNGLLAWDTSQVKDVNSAFYECEKLVDISGLRNWNVSKVTIFNNLFSGDKALNDISPLSSWDTSSATSMFNVFSSNDSLTDIAPLATWDTSNVTKMGSMLYNVKNLTNIDALANWDTSNVTTLSSALAGTSITNVDALANWDTSSVSSMSGMFSRATNLTNIDALANWDTSNVTTLSSALAGTSITNVDALANWDTSNVTTINSMFSGTTSLVDIDALSGWDTSKVTRMDYLFSGATSLVDIDGSSNWTTSNATNMKGMFKGATGIEDISALSNWDVSKVTTMQEMFYNDALITDLSPLGGWVTTKLTSSGKIDMFYGIPSSVTRPTWY